MLSLSKLRLWQSYKTGISDPEVERIRNELNSLLEQWMEYELKFEDDSFSLDDYTNRIEKSGDLPGGYLCNFLENTTKAFGSSRTGSARAFDIKMNEDQSYFVGKKSRNRSYERAVAEEFFAKDIKPLFKSIVGCTDPLEIVHLVETSQYSGKQILRKLAVLQRPKAFVHLYSDGVIDTLYEELIGGDEPSNLGRNHQLRKMLGEVFQLEDTIEHTRMLSNFLWQYTDMKGIADKDSPNVILYGPQEPENPIL